MVLKTVGLRTVDVCTGTAGAAGASRPYISSDYRYRGTDVTANVFEVAGGGST